MDNKPVASSVRLSEEERSKLLELKDQYGISWAELIAYANIVISEDGGNRNVRTINTVSTCCGVRHPVGAAGRTS